MKRTIWWDMDGTIASLYEVQDWLSKLRASDPAPYLEAAVMLNMSLFARYLHKVQEAGYRIGIISWTSMGGSEEYNEAVANAKLDWLAEHLPSVEFDEINIVEYGTPKSRFIDTMEDILFDDNEEIRESWVGTAYEPKDIIRVLKELV